MVRPSRGAGANLYRYAADGGVHPRHADTGGPGGTRFRTGCLPTMRHPIQGSSRKARGEVPSGRAAGTRWTDPGDRWQVHHLWATAAGHPHPAGECRRSRRMQGLCHWSHRADLPRVGGRYGKLRAAGARRSGSSSPAAAAGRVACPGRAYQAFLGRNLGVQVRAANDLTRQSQRAAGTDPGRDRNRQKRHRSCQFTSSNRSGNVLSR